MLIVTRFRIIEGAAFVALAFAAAYAGDARSKPSHESGIVLTASEEKAVAGFETHVKNYMALHRKLERSLPRLPKRATPEQIDKKGQALGALIKTARADAQRGEFFTPEIQALLKRRLEAVLAGPDGKAVKALIMEDNPGMPDLNVNDRYLDSIPLSTMPHRVLRTFPKLEEDLEYRFIGARLALMDAEARIIIDFTDNVLP